MPSVTAIPELMQGAAQDLAGIGSTLAEATTSVSAPTTGIAAAARDEVSIAVAALFGEFGQKFQGVSAQAQAFHTQFVSLLSSSGGAYAGADMANAASVSSAQLAQELNAFGSAVAAPYQALASTTLTNAGAVLAGSQQALNDLSGGVSTALSNPGTLFVNLETAAQSVTLIGANNSIVSAVTNHTLGGVTEAFGGLLGDTMVYDAHVQLFQGLTGDGFTLPSGPVGALTAGLANFASSPLSGVLLGAVGPVVSPGVALFNEAGTIVSDLTGGNVAAAVTQLLDTPATVANAFFNGATLNLDPFAPLVQNVFFSSNEGGTGEVATGLSFAFGGLFSPGQVVTGAGGPMYYGVGGSALNSLGMDLAFFPPDADAGATIAIPAIPVGPIGATEGLVDIIGQALGGTLLG
jgi:PE family